METWEREIIARQIENEAEVLKRLKKTYETALTDTKDKLKALMDRPETASVIHQQAYQKQILANLTESYQTITASNSKTITDFLDQTAQKAHVSTMYGLHKQGVPLILPASVKQAVKMSAQSSVNGIKLSKKLHDHAATMATFAREEMTRGITTGIGYNQIALNLANRSNSSFYVASRIVRTESHRINQEASYETLQATQDCGADMVKEWDSTIDSRVRSTHAELNGQIKKLDAPFMIASTGASAAYPGSFGIAKEDIHCRCVMLHRATWALDAEELAQLGQRPNPPGVLKKPIDAKDLDDFTGKYEKEEKKLADKTAAKVPELPKPAKVYKPEKIPAKKPAPVKVKPVEFIMAKTKGEASEFAQAAFTINAEYAKFDISVANAINETLFKARQVFGPTCLDALQTIAGVPKGYGARVSGFYSPSTQGLHLRNVGTKKSLDKLKEIAAYNHGIGHWSTPAALHTTRHELGHAMTADMFASSAGDDMTRVLRIGALRKQIIADVTKTRKGTSEYSKHLSAYGMTNVKEFVAESIAEYLNGNPREIARRVVEIIINPVKGGLT